MTSLGETASFSNTVPIPDNGETVESAQSTDPVPAGEGPIKPGFQALTNRTRYLLQFTPPAEQTTPLIEMESTDGATVVVTALGRALVFNAVSGLPAAMDPSGTLPASLTVASVNPPAMAFSSNTWYYCYATLTGATFGYEISTIAPDATRTYQSGDHTRRYLGCFRTDGSAAIHPFRMRRGVYRYIPYVSLLSNGSATSWTTVPASGAAPPHARLVQLLATFTSNDAADQFINVREDSTFATPMAMTAAMKASGQNFTYGAQTWDQGVTSAQALDYKVGTSSVHLYLYALGFSE